jgi:hypothetical protein
MAYEKHAMESTHPRGPGRPPGTTKVPADVLAYVWVRVLIARVKARARTGKTPSVRRACRDIVANGGILSAIGGNLDALAAANAKRKKTWQRFEFKVDGTGYGPAAAGSIFVNHAISNAGTLHARYSQANKLATSDRRVRLVWMNLARQMLGLPAKPHVRPFMGRR